jgi:uncharacterized protein YrzB (UPF0473 family)
MAVKEKCDVCGNNMDECICDTEYLTLEFEDGAEVECEIMGVFECDGKEYIALLPEDGTDDVYIYGYKEIDDEEFDLIDIEDDEEFERVVAEFDKVVAEEE